MGISISFGGLGGPLSALAGSLFGSSNSSFPPDASGPAITFTALLAPGVQYDPNAAAAGAMMSFSQGSVRLYLPQAMSSQFSAQYEETAISTLLKPFLKQGSAGLAAASEAAKSGVISNVAKLAGDFVGIEGGQAASDIMQNQAKNNHMEVMFKGMGFRTFAFEFKFFPRNAREMGTLMGICNSFKYHMHPEFKEGTGEAYFTPPSKYSINVSGGSLYGGYTDAVLTDVTINYAGAGVAALHSDMNPAEVDLSLSFKETRYLTKSDFSLGGGGI